MPLQEPCAKCVELWREYGSATSEHIALLKEQEAVAGTDVERFRQLDPLIELAAVKRDAARAAVRLHLTAVHGEQPRTMTA